MGVNIRGLNKGQGAERREDGEAGMQVAPQEGCLLVKITL